MYVGFDEANLDIRETDRVARNCGWPLASSREDVSLSVSEDKAHQQPHECRSRQLLSGASRFLQLGYRDQTSGWQLGHAGANGFSVQFSHPVMSDSCDPMDRSTQGLPVHHQLQEFTQTHVR